MPIKFGILSAKPKRPGLLSQVPSFSSLLIELYIPKYFFTHAASLDKGGRRMISLYNEPVTPVVAATTVVESEPTPEPTPTPALVSEPTPAPVSQPTSEPQRLGDVIAKGVKVLGDKMATEETTTPFNRIPEIRRGIGLNDRFLLIRDLFGGDASLYEETITRLDEFDDLDDCMIYIVENFRWNPDSAGARLLVSLIERKLC